jgi:hypothetical protein
LCACYRRLSAAGKKLPIVIAVVVREIAAFLFCGPSAARSRPPESHVKNPEAVEQGGGAAGLK